MSISASIDLIEDANAFTFWILSSWGDNSLMGNASRSVDTRPPSISTSGIPGNGSWYVSQVTTEASTSDPSPRSDLASFQAAVEVGNTLREAGVPDGLAAAGGIASSVVHEVTHFTQNVAEKVADGVTGLFEGLFGK